MLLQKSRMTQRKTHFYSLWGSSIQGCIFFLKCRFLPIDRACHADYQSQVITAVLVIQEIYTHGSIIKRLQLRNKVIIVFWLQIWALRVQYICQNSLIISILFKLIKKYVVPILLKSLFSSIDSCGEHIVHLKFFANVGEIFLHILVNFNKKNHISLQ